MLRFARSLVLLAAPSGNSRLLYEHGYHAGNFADVIKHTVLIQLLDHMTKKDKPFCYVESHAGKGLYHLTSSESRTLSENEVGIGLLSRSIFNDHDEHDIAPANVDAQNESDDAASTPQAPMSASHRLLQLMEDLSNDRSIYPGSPIIGASMCRPQDKIILCEQDIAQFDMLEENILRYMPRVNPSMESIPIYTHCGNGYGLLKDWDVIDSSKRALIFMDPSYQMGSDTEQVCSCVEFWQAHWRSARVAVWHPVSTRTRDKADALYRKVRQAVDSGQLADTKSNGKNKKKGKGKGRAKPSSPTEKVPILAIEVYDEDDGDVETNSIDDRLQQQQDPSPPRRVGSGMLLINPPYGVDEDLRSSIPAISNSLSQHDQPIPPTVTIRWIP